MPETRDTAAREVSITSSDGVVLHARHWTRDAPRGVVVLAHGFGEHGGFYRHVAQAVGLGAEVELLAPDLRGHGRSPGRRGFVRAYVDLVNDLLAAFAWAGEARPGLPRFILGHSNGGLVALLAALHPEVAPKLAGLIVSNPAIGLADEVPWLKLMLGRILHRFAPWVTLPTPLEAEKLTRDVAYQNARRVDPYVHARISAPFFFGMGEGARTIAEGARHLLCPVLMILGEADPIVNPEKSKALFEEIGSTDKTLLVYPEMLHEPFNDIGREQVLADLSSWLVTHLDAAGGS
jgi:alpha-beta hydrolase superfamily lysophospholipase